MYGRTYRTGFLTVLQIFAMTAVAVIALALTISYADAGYSRGYGGMYCYVWNISLWKWNIFAKFNYFLGGGGGGGGYGGYGGKE